MSRNPPNGNSGEDSPSQSGSNPFRQFGFVQNTSSVESGSTSDGSNQPQRPVQPVQHRIQQNLQYFGGMMNSNPLQYGNPYGAFGGVFGVQQPSGLTKNYVDLSPRELEEELNLKATILLIGDQQMLRAFPLPSVLPQLLSVLQKYGGERQRIGSLILCSRILAQVLKNVPKAVQYALSLPHNKAVNSIYHVLEKQMTYSLELFEEILRCLHCIFRQDITPIMRQKKIIVDLKLCMERSSLPTHIHKLFYEILSDIFRKLDMIVLRDLHVDPCEMISLPTKIEEGLDPQIARQYLRCFGYLVERVPVYVSKRLVDTFLKVLPKFFLDDRYQDTVLKLYIQMASHPKMNIIALNSLIEPEFLEIVRHLMVTKQSNLETITFFLQNLLFSKQRAKTKKKKVLTYQWFWEDDFQNYTPYDVSSNAMVEEAYQKYKSRKYRSSIFSKKKTSNSTTPSSTQPSPFNNCSLNIRGVMYKINFDSWKQVNSRTLVPRNIDREPFFTSILRDTNKPSSFSGSISSSKKKSYNFSTSSSRKKSSTNNSTSSSSSRYGRRRKRSTSGSSGSTSSSSRRKATNFSRTKSSSSTRTEKNEIGVIVRSRKNLEKVELVFRSRLMDEIFSETMSHPDLSILEDIETLLQNFVTVLPYQVVKDRSPVIMTYLRNMVGKNIQVLPLLDALVHGNLTTQSSSSKTKKRKIFRFEDEEEEGEGEDEDYGDDNLYSDDDENEEEEEEMKNEEENEELRRKLFRRLFIKYGLIYLLRQKKKSLWLKQNKNWIVEYEREFSLPHNIINHLNSGNFNQIPLKVFRSLTPFELLSKSKFLSTLYNLSIEQEQEEEDNNNNSIDYFEHSSPLPFLRTHTCEWIQIVVQKLHEIFNSLADLVSLSDYARKTNSSLLKRIRPSMFRSPLRMSIQEHNFTCDPLLPVRVLKEYLVSHYKRKILEEGVILDENDQKQQQQQKGENSDDDNEEEEKEGEGEEGENIGKFQMSDLDKKVDEWKIFMNGYLLDPEWGPETVFECCSLSVHRDTEQLSIRRGGNNVWQNQFRFLVYSPSETKYDLESIAPSTTTTTTSDPQIIGKRGGRRKKSSSRRKKKDLSSSSSLDVKKKKKILGSLISPFFSKECIEQEEELEKMMMNKKKNGGDSFHSKKVIRYLLRVLEHCHFWLVDSLDILKNKFRERPMLQDPPTQIFFNQHLSLRMLSAFTTPISDERLISDPHIHRRSRSVPRGLPRRAVDGRKNVAIALLTGCCPPWIREILLSYPFLVSFEVRYRIFHYFPEKVFEGDCNATPELISGIFKDVSYQVQQRSGILIEADRVLEKNGHRRSLLKYEYLGEPGIGLGPSLEFYSLVAQAFQRRNIGLWSDISSTEELEETAHVRTLDGLFPSQPIRSDRYRYYTFLGRLLSKNVYDERNNIDLPFSNSFVRYFILEKPNRLEHIEKEVDPILCRSIRQIEKMETAKEISSLELYFEYKGVELTDEGEDVQVTIDNRNEYILLLKDFLLDSEGLQESREHFLEGLKCILPLWKWKMFSSRELSEFHFHNNERNASFWEWDEDELLDHIELSSGYTKNSEQVKWLVEIICKKFNPDEKKQFLEFVTGSRTLPVGGFAKLRPKLSVVQIVKTETLDQNQILPTANTCFRKLKLPLYSNPAILLKNLKVAIKFGRGGFQLT